MWGRRGRTAGEIVASEPRDRLVDALLENLSLVLSNRHNTTPQVSLLKRFDDGYEQRIAMWPPEKSDTRDGDEISFEVPDFGVLRIFSASPRSARQRRVVNETIAWLGALMVATPPRRRLEKARHDVLSAQTEVEAFEVRVARARESERIRLVEALTTDTLRDLDEVRAMLAEPAADVPWSSVSMAMGSLIHDFRTTVRGVFPAMLPERGAAETLKEIAASLPIAIEFRGDLGRRPGWEIESGFTHAVAGVLSAMTSVHQAVQVIFERDGAIRARVRSVEGSDIGMLARALTSDRERLEALGGALTITGTGRMGVEVAVTVPDRSEVNWLPLSRQQLASRPVHARVAALLESARLSEEEIAPWRAELFAPVRLLVLQQALPAPLPGVKTVMCEGDPDHALSAQLRDPDGPWGRIDAVVCAEAHDDEFARAMRRGPLLFSSGTPAAEAVSVLTARAPVFAARRALSGITDYVRHRPSTEWLRRQVDHLTAGSHELVEDALLDDLARGTAPSVVDDEAARLIGMHGGDKRTRLGLPEDASPTRVEDATDARLERWTAIVNRPGLDRANHRAAEVVLSSATRLLMQ